MTENNFKDMQMKIEAILFSFGDWISVNDIMSTLNIDSKLLVTNSLQELQAKYKSGFAFRIEVNENLKWRMSLIPEYTDIVSELITSVEMPKAVLKVLSVIAYEQPITKTRLLDILGKSVKKEVDFLYEKKFVVYEKKGIGKYYKVTRKFYDYFNIDKNDDFREQANDKIIHQLENIEQSNTENVVTKKATEDNISQTKNNISEETKKNLNK